MIRKRTLLGSRLRPTVALALLLGAFGTAPALAQSYQVLHSFEPPPSTPYAALIADSAGNLYSTTTQGGASNRGTVFKLDASHNYRLTALHSFAGSDGAFPYAGLIQGTDGNLYGTTLGTVFKIDTNGSTLTTLHTFSGGDGADPFAGLIADSAGNLYGTTHDGGASNYGTVFKLNASNGNALTTLHSFTGADGMNPWSALIADSSGNLYGTAFGGASNYGTVFKLNASNGYALTTLHSFTNSDGAFPYAALIADSSGNLYGTAFAGGASGGGTVFKLDASNGYALTTLTGFSSEASHPHAALIADSAGNLYGTTTLGGELNLGAVFKLDASNGYQLTTLHSFASDAEGANPSAAVITDSAGNLYGTTFNGGSSGKGTVFKLDASNGYALTTLHSFAGYPSDGEQPNAGLIFDSAGNLYGTTEWGGESGSGTVFKLDASNGYALTTLSSFTGSPGFEPYATVIMDAAGNLYGTTSTPFGTVFKLDASNGYALTMLHSFSVSDGDHPAAALIADSSGSLYGTTYQGGASGAGTVFKLDAANGYTLTTLHNFAVSDGDHPLAALIADSSGNLYGTTSGGGASAYGTVFKLDASNGYQLTTLHSFAGGTEGEYPYAALIANSPGNLYGTTSESDILGPGTVFKLDASNGYALTTLHAFAGSDGANPWAALAADSAGNLYGTTQGGGAAGNGVVFRIAVGCFDDVPPTELFATFICTVARDGITAGCGGGNYCPDGAVTRAQMAVFLLRAEHGSGYAPPTCAGIFTDVPCPGGFAVDWIEQLVSEGITAGCSASPPLYCPNDAVTRAQMAVFLLRAEHGSSYTPPACAGIFQDVACTPSPAFAANWIEQLHSEGIAAGCGSNPPLYCPNASNARGQMAVFLVKTFGLQ